MIDKNDPRLTDFVLGELNSAESAEIQDAIANSEELQNAVEDIRQTALLLGAAYQAEEPLRLLDEQKAELTQMQFDEAAHELNRASSSRPWLPIVLAASLLGLLVGGAIYLPDPPVSPEVAKQFEKLGNLSDKELEDLGNEAGKDKESILFAKAADKKGESEGIPGITSKPGSAARTNESGAADRFERVEGDSSRLVKEEKFDDSQDLIESTGKAAPMSESPESWRDIAELRNKLVRKKNTADDLERGLRALDNVEKASRPGDESAPNDDLPLGQSAVDSLKFKVDPFSGEAARSRSIPKPTNPNAGPEMRGSTIIGRDAKDRLGRDDDFDGELDVAQSENSEEGAQMMKMMQQLAGGGREGRQSGGGFGGGGFGGRGGGFGDEGGSSKFGGGSGSGMGLGAGYGRRELQQGQTNRPGRYGIAGRKDPDSPNDSFDGVDFLLKDANSQALKMLLSEEQRIQSAGDPNDGNDLAKKKPVQLENAAGGKNGKSQEAKSDKADEYSLPGEATIDAPLISEVKSENEREFTATEKEQKKLAELRVLGLQFETRIQTQQKSRVVDNGVENFTVEVPQVFADIDPATTRRLVEKLAKRIDPSGKREIVLDELFEKTRELKKSPGTEEEEEEEEDEAAEADGDLLLAIKLRDELSEQFGALRDQFSTGHSKKSGFDATRALQRIDEELQRRNAKVRRTRTWKRVKAIPNTTRLMLGDKTDLDLTGMQVNVQVDGFRARVLLDYFYYNDRGGNPLRGNFKLRLPDDASLYYFAFGESAYDLSPEGEIASEEFHDDGRQFVSLRAEKIRDARQDAWKNVKESRMVPREKAAHAFIETVRRKVDPALAEWSGAGVFNAQVFPIAPHKLHRIVVGYDVNLRKVDGQWVYELDLPEQTGQCQVDINIQPVDGVEYAIEPKSDPVEHVVRGTTQRLYRFEGSPKQTIRLTASKSPEMLLYSAEEFWGVQVTPDLPVEKVVGNPRAIFMVDTSLSSNPDKFNVWLKLLESTLESNRDSLKQFNVVFFNVDAHFWKEKWVDNTQENTKQLLEKCNTLVLEGATDLYGAIEKISQSKWVFDADKEAAGKPKPGPDLFLLSDGAANWGETNLRLISAQIQDHQLGSMFAYQTGMTGTAISGLRFLAGQSGGAVFSVANEYEIKIASTAHRKRPWKLSSITADGASDIMTAGRVQWVYPGQAITIVGRGKVQDGLKLEFEQSGQLKTVTVSPERVESELASRLYGQVAVGQLESLGAKVFDVAASYARHFRVTGETCSLLMLESEADYERFDIKPHEDLFVIKTKQAKDLVADILQKSASELADPKAQLLAWLTRLETMPGMSFKMPMALKIVMDDIQVVAISKPLDCSLASTEGISKEYLAAIQNERLNYELIASEANRRGRTSVDNAIKVFSSLVERNPGDLVIARDVAFTALEMGRPAQAYHLLRSVAKARPFEGSIYPALGQCLTQLGQSDMAIVYYEVALNGSFKRMGEDFQKIVSAEYMYLLRQICDGKLDSSINEFAKARLETLKKNLHFESADLLITMMWNTDQTDVDLHIVEPSGEECSYENKKTRSGGQITSDITTGFGPEMYSNRDAPNGKYEIKVKYFSSNQNRTEMRNKVHLTIYRGFGTQNERVTRKTVQLKKVGEKESVATVGVD